MTLITSYKNVIGIEDTASTLFVALWLILTFGEINSFRGHFRGDSRLVNYIFLQALSFKCAFRLIRAWVLRGSSRRAMDENLLIMGWNDGSHVWHACVAESKGTSVKDLVSWGADGRAFDYDEQKSPSRLILTLPLPCDLSFLVFDLSRCLPCLWIEFHFVVVATFYKR